MIGITDHAYKRAKERLNLNANSLKKLCALAYCYGAQKRDTRGELLKYLQRRSDDHPGNDFRIYGDNLFIFKSNSLVTVYRLPNEVNKKQYIRNEKVHNPKRHLHRQH
ncbi:hypothetical protein ABDK00_001535 [Niabella insulamsoli]|uniref:hypothetical protein n=1 Tax=Niabella insulamsoli TaxID=3144874 RepID=UPI0031FBCA5E